MDSKERNAHTNTKMNPSSNDASDEIKKRLFANANDSKWEEVKKTYKEIEWAHTAKITSSGDTALHIAISNGEESVVKELVDTVCTTPGALEAKNELGNTPLHLAAYLGNANMCRYIARINTKLIGIRNDDNETPFFLAVRHGRKEAFHALHEVCSPEEGYQYCRGKDGETILHSAISGEYFDLALDIMMHYKELMPKVNEQGFSPLHILASKSSAFISGSHIRGLHKLIYHCIFVDELQLKTMHSHTADFQNNGGAKYPQNYGTCVAIFNSLTHVTRALLGFRSKERQDEENIKETRKAETPKGQELPSGVGNKLMVVLCGNRAADAERLQFKDGKQAAESMKRNAQGHEFFPKNYNTLFNFVKLLSKATLVILGLGSKSVQKMREKKAKHIWSLQIMNILLDHAASFDYEYNGRSPRITVPDAGEQPYTLPNSAGIIDFDPNTIENFARDEDEQTPPEKDPVNNKADRDNNKPCKECKELLCSLLNSLGFAKHSAYSALCLRGKGSSGLDMEKRETPILIAAKSGVVEMVAGILKRFPVAIHDMNNEKKNVVLLAVEHRQPHVYKFLLEWKMMKDTIFRKTDKDGNSALHLAAKLSDYRPWLIPGAALQMQWEIKWYEFVKNSMIPHFFPRYNHEFKTPKDIFSQTHSDLAKEGGAWLTNTSQSCSVVAALIATVAFATSATVPGGVKSDNSGTPTLQNEPAFSIFAISSLVALCFSVTSVVMFLAILTSRFQEKDFGNDLPRKLLVGLTSLFISIGSMLLSFCAGHFFVLKEKLQYAAFPMYAVTCLPVTFFAVAQFPLYFDLVWATIRKLPQRSAK